MPLKLYEFQKLFMLNQYVYVEEKVESIGKTFISLGNLIIKFHFRKSKSITFFVNLTFLLFGSGVCLLFNTGNKVNLEKFKPRKIRSVLLKKGALISEALISDLAYNYIEQSKSTFSGKGAFFLPKLGRSRNEFSFD